MKPNLVLGIIEVALTFCRVAGILMITSIKVITLIYGLVLILMPLEEMLLLMLWFWITKILVTQ